MASAKVITLAAEENRECSENRLPLSNMSGDNCININKTPPTKESYWFAHAGGDNALTNSISKSTDPKDLQLQKEREERIRHFREQQEEERIKRLKELEQSFIHAKKIREQQEEERKRKIDEARNREMERRAQVEERKRQIWEAEQERKEAILRRNMEREARIEARRNAQRNSLCFAFGSSTPRTFDLDLAAIGAGRNVNQGSVLMSSISGRRSEERELGPPRATSACSLDKKIGDDCMSRSMVSLSSAFRGRKRTDIMPTPARERSVTPHMTPRGKDSSRSPSRPHSSLSGASEMSATSSNVSAVNMRPRTAPRRPRPFSIHGSIVDRASSTTSNKELERQPRMIERNTSNTVPKPTRMKSIGREKETNENLNIKPKKPVPPPKSAEVISRAKSHPVPIKDNLRRTKSSNEESVEKTKLNPSDGKLLSNHDEAKTDFVDTEKVKSDGPTTSSELSNSEELILSPSIESSSNISNESNVLSVPKIENSQENTEDIIPIQKNITDDAKVLKQTDIPSAQVQEQKSETNTILTDLGTQNSNNCDDSDANLSKEIVSSKPRITSEEEAKIALAEKRRLAREQAEREAELERQKQEELRKQEEEKKRAEELEQKRLEEEQIRLAELHRQIEEEKLRKAIEEREQREKEEREKKEEEARQKAEKEEQERKAREEAERQRIELEERLKKEEEERAERKKRVEQIMARTRGKTSQSSSNNTNDINSKPAKDSSSILNKLNQSLSMNQNTLNSGNNVSIINGSLNSKIDTNSVTTENNVSSASSWSFSQEMIIPQSGQLPEILNSESTSNNIITENGQNKDNFVSKTNIANNIASNKIISANDILSPTQTNGYSSHEDMSCTTSPEETSDNNLLINLENQKGFKASSESNYNLVDLRDMNIPTSNENYLLKVDEVNSNLINSANSLVAFEDSLQNKQETPVAGCFF